MAHKNLIAIASEQGDIVFTIGYCTETDALIIEAKKAFHASDEGVQELINALHHALDLKQQQPFEKGKNQC